MGLIIFKKILLKDIQFEKTRLKNYEHLMKINYESTSNELANIQEDYNRTNKLTKIQEIVQKSKLLMNRNTELSKTYKSKLMNIEKRNSLKYYMDSFSIYIK